MSTSAITRRDVLRGGAALGLAATVPGTVAAGAHAAPLTSPRAGLELPPAGELPVIPELPDPFRFADGSRVRTRRDWDRRREEIAALALHYQYGTLPSGRERVRAHLDGSSLHVSVEADGREATIEATVTLPDDGARRHPVFLHAGRLDPAVFLPRGYALVQVSLPAIAADNPTQAGAFRTLYPQTDTGNLLAWAWGFSRVMDALEDIRVFDERRVAVTGHSRYGKAALAAGAFDERFALTVPASSGLSGAGNYRFFYEDLGANEKIENIVGFAPWWFTPRLADFVGQPERLPFDQHSIMALVAPRALLLTGGTEDYWINPEGAAVTYRAAKEVYGFLEAHGRIGIAYRPGGHAMTTEDFVAMVDFADRTLLGKDVERDFDSVPYRFPIPWDAPSGERSRT